MKLNKIKPFDHHFLQVVIETPKSSTHKYDYDPERELFYLNKVLPMGMAFPFDFGFIPGTKGEDGDPLDVLVMMDGPGLQGTLVSCRVIGVLEATQFEAKGESFRNDRIIAVCGLSTQYKSIKKIQDLHADLLKEIESFFMQYNQLAGKIFRPMGWKGPDKALALIKKQIQ